jgi:hypothetical protein
MDQRLQQEPQQVKRAYSKPELVQVPLRAEEAVLGNCKTSTSAGSMAGASCMDPSSCFTQGS